MGRVVENAGERMKERAKEKSKMEMARMRGRVKL